MEMIRASSDRRQSTFVFHLLLILSIALPLLNRAPLYAQEQTDDNRLFYVVRPLAGNQIELPTHTADLQISVGEDGSPILNVNTLYRIKNQSEEIVVATVEIIAPPARKGEDSFAALSTTVDDLPLALQSTDSTSAMAQISIPAGQDVDLRLRYSAPLRSSLLPTILYPYSWLNEWRGERSTRVSLTLPEAIPWDSEVQIQPDGWRFSPTANPRQPEVKWLYDGRLPTEPFLFQFVAPSHWQRIQAAEDAAKPGASTSAFLQLGNLYRQLYTEPILEQAFTVASRAAQMRFYAQALAAYTDGLTSGTATTGEDSAMLHLALASLYRTRVARPDGSSEVQYAALMADQAARALELLPAEDSRRQELLRWQAEGLYVQMMNAQAQGEWQLALDILQRLERLAPSVSNDLITPERLDQDRRNVKVQQAVEFLEDNNVDAAVALAGEQIADLNLQPPENGRPLFTGWQIYATVDASTVSISATGQVNTVYGEEAVNALRDLIVQWEAAGVQPTLLFDAQGFSLSAEIVSPEDGFALTQATPNSANWAFLRALLSQVQPNVATQNGTLWQTADLEMSVDLRTAGDQWSATANQLERQAEQLLASGDIQSTTSANSAEAALLARIQSINYQNSAETWRALGQRSWAIITLANQNAVRPQTQSRTVTPSSPLQQLALTSHTLDPSRFLLIVFLVVAILFLFTWLLWWLL